MSDRPVQVLVLIGQLGHGGAERQVHEMVRRMDASRYEPVVATFEAGGHYQPLIERAGVPVLVLDKRGFGEASLPFRLVRLIRGRRIGLVHAFLFPAYWRGVLAAGMAGGIPAICAVRSTGIWMNTRHRLMNRLALRCARAVIANAPAVKRDILEATGLEPDKVVVITNGVDTSLFAPGRGDLRRRWTGRADGEEPGPPVVGFIGSLREAKDPLLFMRIAALAARAAAGTRFVVVGDGPLRSRVEEAARREPLEGLVHVEGERSDVAEVLRSLDLLVVSSRREGCCNVILEAMATGLPVVATQVGGNPDLVEPSRTGFLFPHGDAARGAGHVARILQEEGLAKRLGARAREAALERFSFESMMERTHRTYEDVL